MSNILNNISFSIRKRIGVMFLLFICGLGMLFFAPQGVRGESMTDGYTPLTTIPGITEAGKPMANIDLANMLGVLYTLLVGVTVVFAILMIVVAGFQRIMSAGSVSGLESANTRMMNAIYGLLLLLCTYIIMYTINPKLVKVQFLLDPVGSIQQKNSAIQGFNKATEAWSYYWERSGDVDANGIVKKTYSESFPTKEACETSQKTKKDSMTDENVPVYLKASEWSYCKPKDIDFDTEVYYFISNTYTTPPIEDTTRTTVARDIEQDRPIFYNVEESMCKKERDIVFQQKNTPVFLYDLAYCNPEIDLGVTTYTLYYSYKKTQKIYDIPNFRTSAECSQTADKLLSKKGYVIQGVTNCQKAKLKDIIFNKDAVIRPEEYIGNKQYCTVLTKQNNSSTKPTRDVANEKCFGYPKACDVELSSKLAETIKQSDNITIGECTQK